jgi:hypothetical protein
MTENEEKAAFIIKAMKDHGLIDSMYAVLKRPDGIGRLSTGILGFNWEMELVELAKARGMEAVDLSHKNLTFDILINGLKVQAKSTYSRHRMDIRPTKPLVGSHARRYKVGDFDVMAIKTIYGIHFVPAAELHDCKLAGYIRASIAAGDLVRFREAWEALCVGGVRRERTLF